MFFLDTNILVYAWDAKDQRKQSIARGLIRRALVGEGVVSQQVLGEFAAVLLHRMKPAAPASDVGPVGRRGGAACRGSRHFLWDSFLRRAGCGLGGAGRLRHPVFRGSKPRPVLFRRRAGQPVSLKPVSLSP